MTLFLSKALGLTLEFTGQMNCRSNCEPRFCHTTCFLPKQWELGGWEQEGYCEQLPDHFFLWLVQLELGRDEWRMSCALGWINIVESDVKTDYNKLHSIQKPKRRRMLRWKWVWNLCSRKVDYLALRLWWGEIQGGKNCCFLIYQELSWYRKKIFV